MIEGTYYNRQK